MQDYPKWPTPETGSIGFDYLTASTTLITLARDPLDRYGSSYRSKVRCSRTSKYATMSADEAFDWGCTRGRIELLAGASPRLFTGYTGGMRG